MAAHKDTVSRRVDEADGRIDANIPVAAAIADALKVLTALERAPSTHMEGMLTGEGYAHGYALVDATMPELAGHLRHLIGLIRDDVQVLRTAVPQYENARASQEAANG